jgi:hypothetical protein
VQRVAPTEEKEDIMTRRTLTWLPAAVAALLLLSAVPVQAKQPDQKPINGKIELTLNVQPCPDGRFLTWTGTVIIDGVAYGFADEPSPWEISQAPNEKFFYYEEIWTIFELEADENPNTEPLLACNADAVLEGTNNGWGTSGRAFRADGEVTDSADAGPFANVEPGSRMIWRGRVLGPQPPTPGSVFQATMHITP